MAAQEIRVPDIGDFTDVPVIEIHVSPGDTVAVEDPLLTLESDKATLDVPAPVAGTISALAVSVGDTVSEGTVIGTVETTGGAHTPPKERVREAAHPEPEAPASYGSPAGVYDSLEVVVPEIGDFTDIPIIEIHVAVGDTVAAEDPLITLESDKATMDVPAPTAGTVTAIKVSVGDAVSVGTPIVDLSTGQAGTPPGTAPTAQAPAAAAAVRAPSPYTGAKGDVHAEVLVLGAGPGGYTAAFRAADLGRKVVMVDSRGPLGGVCLNVGCIPSKALLHAAKVIAETKEMSGHGLLFAAPTIDLDALRSWKDGVVNRLTGGLTGLAKQRKVTTVVGTGTFTSPNMLQVAAPDGSTSTVSFDAAIIAAGSEPVALPFVPHDDPRVIDSTGALDLADIPETLLVLGGGIIGLTIHPHPTLSETVAMAAEAFEGTITDLYMPKKKK
jgi:dihydrolipoamide dehydrogenase